MTENIIGITVNSVGISNKCKYYFGTLETPNKTYWGLKGEKLKEIIQSECDDVMLKDNKLMDKPFIKVIFTNNQKIRYYEKIEDRNRDLDYILTTGKLPETF